MIVAGLDVETLYRNYGHSVLRRARQILGSEDEAAEVLQELFAGLVARPQQFDGRSAPSTFLYAATTHACLSRLRDQRNRRRLLDEQVRPWVTEVDPRPVGVALELREVLARLTDDEAHAAVYHYLDGMSHAEIAEVLGCSRRRVGDLLARISRRFAGDPRSVRAASELGKVLVELTEDEARAAVYHYLGGMSHAEVAEVLGCSRRRVGDLLARVSRRLVESSEAT